MGMKMWVRKRDQKMMFVAISPRTGPIVVPAKTEAEFVERLKKANYLASEGVWDRAEMELRKENRRGPKA